MYICTLVYVHIPGGAVKGFTIKYVDMHINSIVVKTLRMVLCSSRDGVPLKLKKENGRPGILKLSID